MINLQSCRLHTRGAADASVFPVATVMPPPAYVCALGQAAFTSIAIHVIKKNWSRTLTEVRG